MQFKAIGDYKVYKDGTVVSVKGQKEKTLKQNSFKSGYKIITLRIDGQSQRWLVHRLVATLFIPNVDNKPQVDHIDGDKSNNNVSNLRWATALENRHNPNTTENCNGHLRSRTGVTVNGMRIYTYKRGEYIYNSYYKLKGVNENGICLQ